MKFILLNEYQQSPMQYVALPFRYSMVLLKVLSHFQHQTSIHTRLSSPFTVVLMKCAMKDGWMVTAVMGDGWMGRGKDITHWE